MDDLVEKDSWCYLDLGSRQKEYVKIILESKLIYTSSRYYVYGSPDQSRAALLCHSGSCHRLGQPCPA